MRRTLFVIALLALAASPLLRAAAGPTVTVRNPLALARTSETITLRAAEVLKAADRPTTSARSTCGTRRAAICSCRPST